MCHVSDERKKKVLASGNGCGNRSRQVEKLTKPNEDLTVTTQLEGWNRGYGRSGQECVENGTQPLRKMSSRRGNTHAVSLGCSIGFNRVCKGEAIRRRRSERVRGVSRERRKGGCCCVGGLSYFDGSAEAFPPSDVPW